jgi:hypothetical protein
MHECKEQEPKRLVFFLDKLVQILLSLFFFLFYFFVFFKFYALSCHVLVPPLINRLKFQGKFGKEKVFNLNKLMFRGS